MATGYYTRISNTDVSGNELQTYLTGPNVRLLEFDAACGAPLTALAPTAAGVTLSVDQWLQSAISSQLLDNATAAATCYINLGSDVASQAAQYISLFNLKSSNDTRILRFVQTTAPASGKSCILRNLSATDTYINVALDGTASSSSELFVQANAVGSTQAGAFAGLERIVLLSASNLTSGSEVVTFNILSGSK